MTCRRPFQSKPDSSVANYVIDKIGAPKGRVEIEKQGHWISQDRLVYVEHGHQIGREVNRLDAWPRPFLHEDGRELDINESPEQQGAARIFLRRPWGEQFVQQFYNDLEDRYPIIDNFASERLGIKYGVAAEGLRNLAADAAGFVRFYLMEVSARQFLNSLGSDRKVPEWDIGLIRKQGERFLAESLEEDDPIRDFVRQETDRGTLEGAASELSDQELVEICDYRFLLRQSQVESGAKPTVELCSRRSLGYFAERLLAKRRKVFRQHLEKTRQSVTPALDFRVFVWSHTHLADSGFLPFEGTGQDWQPHVVNTGAWQRTATKEQIETIQRRRGLKAKDVLKLRPEILPACYSFVLIEPYETNPVSRLRYWSRQNGRWGVYRSCE